MNKEIQITEQVKPLATFCKMTLTSLEIDKNATFKDWEIIGEGLNKFHRGNQWWIGDWIIFGEDKHPEKYSQALDETDYEYKTLRNIRWVAKNVPMSLRRDTLSFKHHEEVAKLEEQEQEQWLKKAEKDKLSVRELKIAIKKANKPERKIIIPKGIKNTFKHGDFRELIKKVPDNSVDLILTDPPYPKEYLPLWSDLAKEAERVLKPSGFLISYSGQNYFPEVMNMLGGHLQYYWLGMLYHKGNTGQRFDVNMWNRAKPILFYYKEPREKQEKWIEDVVISQNANKDTHEWGQSVEPLITLLEAFSNPGELVLDPFVGGGSTIEACMATKRHFIGYEIEEEMFNQVNKRIK